jgi:hypothetical protein
MADNVGALARTVKAKGRAYTQYFIYLPADLVKDSAFLFHGDDPITIRVTDGALIVSKRAS